MTIENAVRERINELARKNNITKNKVSTLAGLNHTTLLAFMNNETHNPRISTLLHICEAFNIKLWQFFYDSRFDEVEASEWRKEKVDKTAI